MRATRKLHEMGQSLWLDNITRGLLTSDTLRRYIQEFSVTGLTSNPYGQKTQLTGKGFIASCPRMGFSRFQVKFVCIQQYVGEVAADLHHPGFGGAVVQPASCTRRVASSSTNSR